MRRLQREIITINIVTFTDVNGFKYFNQRILGNGINVNGCKYFNQRILGNGINKKVNRMNKER